MGRTSVDSSACSLARLADSESSGFDELEAGPVQMIERRRRASLLAIALAIACTFIAIMLVLRRTSILDSISPGSEIETSAASESFRRAKIGDRPKTDLSVQTSLFDAKPKEARPSNVITIGAGFGEPGALSMGLYMHIAPAGPYGALIAPRKVLIDTGSSALAFCPMNASRGLNATGYFEADVYGGCWWWGKAYQSPLIVNDGEMVIFDATYAIIEEEFSFCNWDGTFGISFARGYFGTKQFRLKDGLTRVPMIGKGADAIPNVSMIAVAEEHQDPMLHQLSHEGGIERLGIYWSGIAGDNQGAIYLDDEAISNSHYGLSQKTDWLGDNGHYGINIEHMTVNGKKFMLKGTQHDCLKTGHNQPCILDTGTPAMVVPQNVFEALEEARKDASSKEAIEAIEFSVVMTGKNGGDPVTLVFDIMKILDLHNTGYEAIQVAGAGEVILGLPTWAFYYIVFDITEMSVSFTPQTPLPWSPTCQSLDCTCCVSATMAWMLKGARATMA